MMIGCFGRCIRIPVFMEKKPASGEKPEAGIKKADICFACCCYGMYQDTVIVSQTSEFQFTGQDPYDDGAELAYTVVYIASVRGPGRDPVKLEIAELTCRPQCTKDMEIIGHNTDCSRILRESTKAVGKIGAGVGRLIFQKDAGLADPLCQQAAADAFGFADAFVLSLPARGNAECSGILFQITGGGRDAFIQCSARLGAVYLCTEHNDGIKPCRRRFCRSDENGCLDQNEQSKTGCQCDPPQGDAPSRKGNGLPGPDGTAYNEIMQDAYRTNERPQPEQRLAETDGDPHSQIIQDAQDSYDQNDIVFDFSNAHFRSFPDEKSKTSCNPVYYNWENGSNHAENVLADPEKKR